MQSINELDMFVCVEVLRPSQPDGIMSSVVSLPKAKKKLLDSQALIFFFQKIDRCRRLYTFIFQLGTFSDIWVCLAEQNGYGFTGSI